MIQILHPGTAQPDLEGARSARCPLGMASLARWVRAVSLSGIAVGWVVFSGCGALAPQASGPEDWRAWRVARHQSIAGTNGWTTLVGRHWLEEGPNTAGAAVTNQVVFPAGRVADRVGVFHRRGKSVRFEAARGVEARVDGENVTSVELVSDTPGPATRLRLGALTVNVMERGERGEKIGLRVRDPESPARKHFRGTRCFPYDPGWRIAGRFVAHSEPRELRVLDVTGTIQLLKCPGVLVFHAAGGEHRLQVVEEPDEDRLFVIFRDETAGRSTYSAGRFLYVDRPWVGEGDRVVIDFNRSYTPPCGFTPFATCPLPPAGNRLPFEIRAGERKPAGH